MSIICYKGTSDLPAPLSAVPAVFPSCWLSGIQTIHTTGYDLHWSNVSGKQNTLITKKKKKIEM